MLRRLAAIVSMFLALPAMAEATGKVVGADGAPVVGADVCIYSSGQKINCVTTDDSGHYRMENPTLPNLLIQAKGYTTKMVVAEPQKEPIVLTRTAILLVKVVDAITGEPISKGSVSVSLPSGRKVGSPVPFNRAGVRLSTLAPGETMVRAEAEGYEPGGPLVVDLPPGEEKTVVVPMRKLSSK
jgi:hypothetical protein